MARILLVDGEPSAHENLRSLLEPDKHTVSLTRTIAEARVELSNNQFDVIVSEFRFLDGDGVDLLAAAHQIDLHVAVILLSGTATLELAVEGIRKGAFDFLAKPLAPETLQAAIQRASEHTLSLRVKRNGNHPANLTWIETLPPSFDLRDLLSTIEKSVIERTLQATGGAQAEAARRLGLSRSDLSYKLLKYELRKETTVC